MKQCEELGKLPQPIGDVPGVVLDEALYLLGGASGQDVLDDILRIDVETGTVETVGSLPMPIRGHQAVLIDDQVYILGGFSDGTKDTVFRLDLRSGKSEKLSPMPRESAWFTVCYNGGCLYVMGGFTIPDGYWNDIAIYDIMKDEWTLRKETFQQDIFPKRRLGSNAAVSRDHKIFSFGGADTFDPETMRANALSTCATYYPDREEWEPLSCTIEPREGLVVIPHGDDIYLIGGMGEPPDGAYDKIDRLDLETETAKAFARLNVGRVAPAAGIVKSRLIIAGGVTESIFTMTDGIDVIEVR